jgi:hypothetical protein
MVLQDKVRSVLAHSKTREEELMVVSVTGGGLLLAVQVRASIPQEIELPTSFCQSDRWQLEVYGVWY